MHHRRYAFLLLARAIQVTAGTVGLGFAFFFYIKVVLNRQ